MKLTSCEKTLIRTSNKRPITLNQSKHVKKVRGQKKIQMGVAVFGGFVQWKQRKFRFLRMKTMIWTRKSEDPDQETWRFSEIEDWQMRVEPQGMGEWKKRNREEVKCVREGEEIFVDWLCSVYSLRSKTIQFYVLSSIFSHVAIF